MKKETFLVNVGKRQHSKLKRIKEKRNRESNFKHTLENVVNDIIEKWEEQ